MRSERGTRGHLPGPGTSLIRADEYGIALVLILATIIVSAADVGTIGQLIAALLGATTLVFILVTSRTSRHEVRLAVVIIVLAVIAATAAVGLGNEARNPYSLVLLLLGVVAPISIIRRLLGSETITMRTVAGALCLYLLIGLFFASVYSIIDGLAPPFFAQSDDPTPSDFIYFSYITITTVGYGDFAASGLGHMLAATEALIGQIYLVAGVALLVANLGRTRSDSARDKTDLLDELRAISPHENDVP